jgi:hypothetical protein
MMMNFPTLLPSKSTNSFDGIEFCHRGKRLIEVNTGALLVAAGTEAGFILGSRG